MKSRLNPGKHAIGAITAHQDAEILDPQGLHSIQFADKTLMITAFPIRSQDRAVPEIRSDERIGPTVPDELPAGNGHEG